MIRDEDISCHPDDDTVRCEIEGMGEVEMQDGHRDVVEEQFGEVASLDSCAHMSEAFLQEYHEGGEETPPRTAAGVSLIYGGCPVPVFDEEL